MKQNIADIKSTQKTSPSLRYSDEENELARRLSIVRQFNHLLKIQADRMQADREGMREDRSKKEWIAQHCCWSGCGLVRFQAWQ